MTTVKVRFSWEKYRPDARQYKQQSIEVDPTIGESWDYPLVEVDLPVNLLANAEDYLKAGIEGTKPSQPILSIKAVKYLVDEWEKVFSDPQVAPDDFKPATDDDDWNDDDTPKTNSEKAAEQGNDDDNWDEVDKTENPEEHWDDTAEDWGEDK